MKKLLFIIISAFLFIADLNAQFNADSIKFLGVEFGLTREQTSKILSARGAKLVKEDESYEQVKGIKSFAGIDNPHISLGFDNDNKLYIVLIFWNKKEYSSSDYLSLKELYIKKYGDPLLVETSKGNNLSECTWTIKGTSSEVTIIISIDKDLHLTVAYCDNDRFNNFIEENNNKVLDEI